MPFAALLWMCLAHAARVVPDLAAACVDDSKGALSLAEEERSSAVDALVVASDGSAVACVKHGLLVAPRPELGRPPAELPLSDCDGLGALDGGKVAILARSPTPSLLLLDLNPMAQGQAPAILGRLALPAEPPPGMTMALDQGWLWLAGVGGASHAVARWDGRSLLPAEGRAPRRAPPSYPPGSQPPDGTAVLARRAVPERPGWAEVVERRAGADGSLQLERRLIRPDGKVYVVHEPEELVGRVSCLAGTAEPLDQPARDLAPGPGSTWVEMFPVATCASGGPCVVFVWFSAP